MNRITAHAVPLVLVLAAAPARPPQPPQVLPVRELTVFKDGHAFVVRRGTVPTGAGGHVVLDELPAPVLGTFWPFASDERARLQSVVVGQREVTVARTARDVRELIDANHGAEVIVTESGRSYSAAIQGVLRGPGALGPEPVPETVLLKVADGVRAVPLARIEDVTFKRDFATDLERAEQRDRMTLRLDWGAVEPRATADIGMMYLQKGLRWIPSYKVELDGKGRAEIALQATLINELADLDDVTANLVIGVPRFEFEHTLDPLALQQAAAALSPWFERGSQTAYALSNAIMAQTARMTELRVPAAMPASPGAAPATAEGAAHEDLFVFTVPHLSVRRGERIVVPVARVQLPYDDVYALDVPMTPPREVWQQFDDQRRAQLAALFAAPKVEHRVRLRNTGAWPLTTAPALLLRDGRVLAQGMMTYTAPGASSDLAVTTAVDVAVEKSDRETGRDPKAQVWRGDDYMRIDLAGALALTNHGARTIAVEVTRHVLGNVDLAGSGGAASRANLLEAPVQAAFGGAAPFPSWWGWWSWPWWWHNFNGISRIAWRVELAPGQRVELEYGWHYYWR